MTLLVAGILLGIGVPNVMEFQRNGRMTAAANDLITAITLARNEAVKRQVPTTWCFSDDALVATPRCLPTTIQDSVQGLFTVNGFVTWVDENNNGVLTDGTDGNAVIDAGETILARGVAPGVPIRYSASCGHVTYSPTGFRRQVGAMCGAAAAARVILLCDDRGRRVAGGALSSARVVRVDRLGRAHAMSETNLVNPVITTSLPIVGVTPTCPP
jgi:type IV fimbrial biogenesis protein FimT